MSRAMKQMRQNGLAAQVRVLTALILRETATRFGRSKAGYLWAVAEPAGFIALLSIVFSQLTHDPPYGQCFPLFYATGYLAFSLYTEIGQQTARAVAANRPLLAFPPVTPLDAVLARFILQLLTWLSASTLILTGIIWWFAEPVRLDLWPIFQMLCLGSLMGLGVGLTNAVLYSWSKSWELFFEIVRRPLFLISGIFFSFESLPVEAREVLWWNPLIHLVGLMRRGFYPVYDGAYISTGYLLTIGLCTLLTGLFLMTRFGNRLAEA